MFLQAWVQVRVYAAVWHATGLFIQLNQVLLKKEQGCEDFLNKD